MVIERLLSAESVDYPPVVTRESCCATVHLLPATLSNMARDLSGADDAAVRLAQVNVEGNMPGKLRFAPAAPIGAGRKSASIGRAPPSRMPVSLTAMPRGQPLLTWMKKRAFDGFNVASWCSKMKSPTERAAMTPTSARLVIDDWARFRREFRRLRMATP